jgi:transposase
VFAPADVDTRKISLLNEHRRTLVGELVRLTNRLRDTLKGYFPLALIMLAELDTLMACAFLLRWPTLDKLSRTRNQTIREFYTSHRSRSSAKIEARIEALRNAVALTNDEAIVEVGRIAVTAMVPVIKALLESIAMVDLELDQAYQSHAEFELIDSFPGAGRVMGPRLLAILGSDRSRFESATELQCMTAAAPVTIQSGTSRLVQRRYRRSKFVHQTVIEWAGHSIRSSLWARAFYDSQRARGKSHWVALRALSFKWLRILFRCWKNGTPYDEQIYIEALIRAGSHLVSAIESAAA